MKQLMQEIEVATTGQGLYAISDRAAAFVAESGIVTGQLTLYCRHTSASLTIQECADPDVLTDLGEFFSRLVPEGMEWLRHTVEGADDMPAHIKTALTDVSVSIPVIDGAPALGTWQGIFLFEHRRRPHRRTIILHVIGE